MKKKVLVVESLSPEVLETVEAVLKVWGYETISATDASEAVKVLEEVSPHLIIACFDRV